MFSKGFGCFALVMTSSSSAFIPLFSTSDFIWAKWSLIKNPEIIVLDEATSGLDTFTEENIYHTIKKLKKTVIVVSHRINSLKFCDKIYHLKNGKAHLLRSIK